MQFSLPLEIPDGVLVKNALCVVSFFGEDGRIKYHFDVEGDEPITSHLGLLTLVQRDILTWSQRD